MANHASAEKRNRQRVVQTERTVPEIDAITRELRAGFLRMRIAMVERAVARGELPKGVDASLIVDLVSAPVQQALLFSERLDPGYVERVIDVVVAGATAVGPAARNRVRKPR